MAINILQLVSAACLVYGSYILGLRRQREREVGWIILFSG